VAVLRNSGRRPVPSGQRPWTKKGPGGKKSEPTQKRRTRQRNWNRIRADEGELLLTPGGENIRTEIPLCKGKMERKVRERVTQKGMCGTQVDSTEKATQGEESII